jgi:hypothetical protein
MYLNLLILKYSKDGLKNTLITGPNAMDFAITPSVI